MFSVKIFHHKNISEEYLSEAAKIKSLRWKYSEKEHLVWMTKNLSGNDDHLLLYSGNDVVGYANLVDITVNINNQNIKVKGVGNVCTAETGKGFGNILMEEVNTVLTQNQWKGILLCKDHLTAYYEKFNWKLINKNVVITEKFHETNFMVYNFEDTVTSLEYDDRNF